MSASISQHGTLPRLPLRSQDKQKEHCTGSSHVNSSTTSEEQSSRPEMDVKASLKATTSQSAPTTTITDVSSNSSTGPILVIAAIFVLSVMALFIVYLNFPELEESEKAHITLPKNIEDAKNLGKVLSHYKDMYYLQVFGGYFITFIFLQSFAIPGSIFLSILSGFLFPFPLALFTVCLCSAVGASFCYLISYLVGRRLVQRYVPEGAQKMANHVKRHEHHLLYYIIFLRITPFLPNWFINLVSPVINVPLFPFFFGTFLGVAPPSFVAIQAGKTLHQLTSTADAISFNSLIVLAIFALLSLVPVIFQRRLKEKFD